MAWYVEIEGEVIGPLQASELRKKVASGEIEPDTPIRSELSGEWEHARKFKGLFDMPVKPVQKGDLPVAPAEKAGDNKKSACPHCGFLNPYVSTKDGCLTSAVSSS